MRTARFLFLSLCAVACGGTPAPAPSTPSTSETAAAPEKKAPEAAPASAVDTAALDKLTAEEAKSGTCDADHKAAIEKLLDEAEKNIRAKTEEGAPLKIESFTKRTLALSDAAKGVQLTLTGKGTQVHVVAFSPKELSLDVLAGKEAATTMRSTYKADLTKGPATITLPKVGTVPLESDSRQVEMKVGTPLEVRLRGHGCAGFVVFSKS